MAMAGGLPPADGWFCVVIERQERAGRLRASDRRIRRSEQIYLLGSTQRLGLGRRLVGHVVRRFMASGITRMTLSRPPIVRVTWRSAARTRAARTAWARQFRLA
jgi:GNAT superfamily N-acetyltransferase